MTSAASLGGCGSIDTKIVKEIPTRGDPIEAVILEKSISKGPGLHDYGTVPRARDHIHKSFRDKI